MPQFLHTQIPKLWQGLSSAGADAVSWIYFHLVLVLVRCVLARGVVLGSDFFCERAVSKDTVSDPRASMNHRIPQR